MKTLGSSGQFNIVLGESHKLGIIDCLKLAKWPEMFRTQQNTGKINQCVGWWGQII